MIWETTVPTYGEVLKEATKVAVTHSIRSVLANRVGESLNGYAIITDDDLSAIGYCASTNEYTNRQAEAYVRFEPVDWDYNDGVEAFDDPRTLLRANYDATTTDDLFRSHVDTSFATLVAALRELKAEGLFGDEVFLTVISTDPSAHLEMLECHAVRTLNTPELVRQWEHSREE